MYGIYLFHNYPIDAKIFASYKDIYVGGVEYHPRRKKLKGYQKVRK